MIVHYNVCDHCGNQTQIHGGENSGESKNGFEFCFYMLDLEESIKGNRFGSSKYKSATFCDRECLVEFMKANLELNGRLK